jgi:hypothetical protein
MTTTPVNNQNSWQAREAALEAFILQLEQACEQDATNIANLEKELDGLNEQLNSAKPGDDTKALQAQIAALKGQIGTATNKLNQDQKSLANAKGSLNSFLQNTLNNAFLFGNTQEALDQTANKAAATDAAHSVQETNDNNAEEYREKAFQSIEDEMALEQSTAEDALQRLSNIQADQKDIAADKAKEQELKNRITEDSIGLAACVAGAFWSFGLSLAGAGYLSADLAKTVGKLNETKADKHAKEADLKTQMAALKADLSSLGAANTQDIDNLINGLFDAVGKLLAILGDKGKAGEGQMQQASCLIAEVMSFLQMLTTKVQQIRSDDQQWMTRANAAESEIATSKSQVTASSVADLQQYASFMSFVMKAVQIVTTVASLAISIASGGALAISMAVLMTVLTMSGAFDKMTTAIAQDIAGSDNPPLWAKVVADLIITVVTVIATVGVGAGLTLAAAGDQACTRVTSAVTSEVASEVETEVAGAAKQAEEVAVSSVKSSMKAYFSSISVKTLVGLTAVDFGATNGIVDLIDFFYAAGIGKANASAKDLANDNAFQILQIVAGVVQAIAEFAAAKGVAGGTTEKLPGFSNFMNKFENLPQLMNIAQWVQNSGMLASAAVGSGLAANSGFKGKLIEMLGDAEANLTTTKALGKNAKIFEQKEVELFVNKEQELTDAIQLMVKKSGQAEMEAARMLEQTAV